jgi:hypothetical protein
MQAGQGTVSEIYFEGVARARIACASGLVPAPGQYLLAESQLDNSDLLPYPIFTAGQTEEGFLAASPWPATWVPGMSLNLRGPLGHGFSLPPAARKVALAALGDSPSRLAGLIAPFLARGAAVALLSKVVVAGLPNEVEIMPVSMLTELSKWADYLALEISRENVKALPELLGHPVNSIQGQALVTSPMPCGGRGDCGVCALTIKRGYQLICKDGPVFDLKNFL